MLKSLFFDQLDKRSDNPWETEQKKNRFDSFSQIPFALPSGIFHPEIEIFSGSFSPLGIYSDFRRNIFKSFRKMGFVDFPT